MLHLLRSGNGVIAALGISFLLFFAIIFVTFPVLRSYAGGLDPFDGRAFGYSLPDTKQLLLALGEPGRSYYLHVQLWLDTVYPASYGVSRALALGWLVRPGRAVEHGLPGVTPILLITFPFVVAALDWIENAAISAMLTNWQDPGQQLVSIARAFSTLKSLGSALTDTLMLVLFAMYIVRNWRRRKVA